MFWFFWFTVVVTFVMGFVFGFGFASDYELRLRK